MIMKQAKFCFSPQLDLFLHPSQRGKIINVSFRGRQSIKHLIEALRVPHTEVGELRANGVLVDFTYLVRDGDYVKVYPSVNEFPGENSLDVGIMGNTLRFVLDNHLGKLARYLRMMGYDTLYCNDYRDEELARISEQDLRFLLTRDRGLLMRKMVTLGYCVRSKVPKQQLVEVAERFDLFSSSIPFQRCLLCNSQLLQVEKHDIVDRLRPLTKKYYNEFHLCPKCNQIYWKGSHFEHMQKFIEDVRNGS